MKYVSIIANFERADFIASKPDCYPPAVAATPPGWWEGRNADRLALLPGDGAFSENKIGFPIPTAIGNAPYVSWITENANHPDG
jgi:hypothetical protein